MHVPTCLLAVLGLSPVALAGTWTVAPAPGPGVDFVTIQAAIDAAADGDLILVQTGAYLENLHVNGKGLTLQGLSNVSLFFSALTPSSEPLLLVENLAAGQELHFRDFFLTSADGLGGEAVRLANNMGRVWIEQVFVDSFDGHSMVVRNSQDVMLSEVFLQTGSAFVDAQGAIQSGHGLVVEQQSSVRAFKLDAVGSHTPPLFTTITAPIPGGDGVLVSDSSLYLSGSNLQGGSGGSFFDGSCSTGAIGGPALRVVAAGGPAPVVQLRGGSLSAGSSGFFQPGCGTAPGQAQAIEDPSGAVVQLAGTPRLLDLPTTPYPNGNFEFQLHGGSNDVFFVYASLVSASPKPLSGIDGAAMIAVGSSAIVAFGHVGASGITQQPAHFLTPGAAFEFHAQALFLDVLGALWVSGPESILFH